MDEAIPRDQPTEEELLHCVPTRISGRHAFVHERLLIVIAQQTEMRGSYIARKRETAHLFNCGLPSINRAIRILRREDLIKSFPRFGPAGEQVGNEYRATDKGFERAEALLRQAASKIPKGL